MTDRGVSTALTYALVIGLITLLVALLFVSMAGFVETRERATAQSTLETVGHNLAADLNTADRLATAEGGAETVELETELPARVVDSPYTIQVNESGDNTLRLWTHTPEIEVTIRFDTDLPIAETRVEGGTVLIELDENTDQLVVRNG